MLTQADILREYRKFNPETGQFDHPVRKLRDYADLLEMDPGHLSRILSGVTPPGLTVLERLARVFPAAADDIASVLRGQTEEAVPA